MRCSDRITSQRGFSLMEVMTAALVLSGMVIGIGSSWVVADRETASLITRQKAIFIADAEMERLTTLYGTSNFGNNGASSTTGYTETAAFPSTRLIYPTSLSPGFVSSSQNYVTTAVSTFSGGTTSAAFQVWVNSDLTTSLNRAYVWVDQEHNVLGRISWTTSNISPSTCTVGGDGCPCLDYQALGQAAACMKLVFYLEYPYRLVSSAPVADSNLQTISLSTIVGRHT